MAIPLRGARAAAEEAYGKGNWKPVATPATQVWFSPLPWVYARNRGCRSLPRPRPVQPSSLIADRKFHLRRRLECLDMITARTEFFIFMGDDGVDAVFEAHLRPDAPSLLSLEQIGI